MPYTSQKNIHSYHKGQIKRFFKAKTTPLRLPKSSNATVNDNKFPHEINTTNAIELIEKAFQLGFGQMILIPV